MTALPIYLLRGEETAGPFEYSDIESMEEDSECTLGQLSCVEGMPGWRSLEETMVWSQSVFLESILDVAKDMASRMAVYKLELRDVRLEIKKALMGKNILTAKVDKLATIIQANGFLEQMHTNYVQKEQSWNVDTFEFYPVQELVPLAETKFARNWKTVWQQAGGIIYEGKMVARKDDPVWLAISDFQYPVPPFSIDPTIWLQSIGIQEAEKIGVPDLARKISLPEIKPLTFIGIPNR